MSFHGYKLFPYHHVPTCYHDREYFGVAYLLRQSGEKLPSIKEVEKDNDDDDCNEVQDSSMDEGFIDSSADMPPFEEQDLMVSVETLGDEDEAGEKDIDEQHEEEVSCYL